MALFAPFFPETPTACSRPVWLLDPAQRLMVRQAQPVLEGRPVRLLTGPERIESGWWDSAGLASRDYFIAMAHDGALVWIYRTRLPEDAGSEGWFVQGWFG